MITDRPAPLVPEEVDLRRYGYMPLDVVRLRDSELAATPNAEVFRAAVLSWCVSWHQIPAASLPDDDAILARLLGYGRDVRAWRKIRAAGGLRGWTLCTDGRLYHAVVAAKAIEAWATMQAMRARTAAARRARDAARQASSQSLSQTPTVSVTETVATSKGEERREEDQKKRPSASRSGADAGDDDAADSDPETVLWTAGVRVLTGAGQPERAARSLLGHLRNEHGSAAVAEAVAAAIAGRASDPAAYIRGVLRQRARRAADDERHVLRVPGGVA